MESKEEAGVFRSRNGLMFRATGEFRFAKIGEWATYPKATFSLSGHEDWDVWQATVDHAKRADSPGFAIILEPIHGLPPCGVACLLREETLRDIRMILEGGESARVRAANALGRLVNGAF